MNCIVKDIKKVIRMTTPLHNAIIITSFIRSLLSSYDAKDRKENIKPIQILRQRCKKFMTSRSRTNYKVLSESVKIGDAVWQDTINHFANKNLKIEVISTVVRLYDLYEEELGKYASIHSKQIEALAIHQTDVTTKDIEHTSYIIADYMLERLSAFTGKHRRKLNLLQKVVENE